MSVTFVFSTQMGPYPSGSRLSVSPNDAKYIVQQYGDSVTIKPQYPGTYWFAPGSVLYVDRKYNPYPPGPQPQPVGYINAVFKTTATDPTTDVTYYQGQTYRMTPEALRRLQRASPQAGIIFTDARGNYVQTYQLDQYLGQVIYVDQAIYTMQQQSNPEQPTLYGNTSPKSVSVSARRGGGGSKVGL